MDPKDIRFIKRNSELNKHNWRGSESTIADIESHYWNYLDPDGNTLSYIPYIPQDGILYQPGIDQFGRPYRIEYIPIKNTPKGDISKFEIFPLDGDMYQDRDGWHFAEWSEHYTPNQYILDEVVATPKTGKLILRTHYPVFSDYPFTGHSEIDLMPDYDYNYMRNLSMLSSDAGYNFVTNNCSDATRMLLEELFNAKMDYWFFNTPGDTKSFAKNLGGYQDNYGNVVFDLNEDQMIKAADIIDRMQDAWEQERKYESYR